MIDKPRAFISHVHEDTDCARALKAWILQSLHGAIDPFLAVDLLPGVPWLRKIEEALQEAGTVLTLVSPNSLQREWLYFESGAGFGRGIPVVPMCWGGVSKGDLIPPLSGLQAIDLPDGYASLLQRLGAMADLDISTTIPPPDLPPFSSGSFVWKPRP